MAFSPLMESLEVSDLEYDLDSFFNSVPEDFAFDDFNAGCFEENPVFPSPGTSEKDEQSPELESPTGSLSLWAIELERFLLEEVDGGGGDAGKVEDFVCPEEFLSDVFADESGKSLEEGGVGKEGVLGERSGGEEESIGKKRSSDEEKSGQEVEEDISKKRIRQLRNRDSAMKSRERRKFYVQNLEVKSKFLEAECRRLEHLLHCCRAENLALHNRLQKDRATGVSQAKQESAVLFEESLLLGSLFWLVSIVFLFLAPNLLAWSLRVEAMERQRGLGKSKNQEIFGTKSSRNKMRTVGLGSELIFMRRRYKALKPKIKGLLISSCA